MDFIVELPVLKGYSQIWIVFDRFTKIAHFILIKDESQKAPDLASVFKKEICTFIVYRIDIVSDQDRRFTSEFWSELCKYLGISQCISTSF
jgi:hypothetical protein